MRRRGVYYQVLTILLSDSIDLVIFDCDGVLIDSEVISARVIVEMLAAEGVSIDLDYVFKHFLGQQFSCVGSAVLQNFSVKLPESFESNYRQKLLVLKIGRAHRLLRPTCVYRL